MQTVASGSDAPHPADGLILRAAQVASQAHAGQTRKYNHRPYITHPARVAAATMLQPGVTAAMACAAWLHDVVEDCGITIDAIARDFGDDVARLVSDLTKVDSPAATRADRAAAARRRLASADPRAKVIKLIDRIDNLRELDAAPAEIRALYVEESQLLLEEALAGASPSLEAELRGEIARHQQMLAEQG